MKSIFTKNDVKKSEKVNRAAALRYTEADKALNNKRPTKTFVAPFKEDSLFYNPYFILR